MTGPELLTLIQRDACTLLAPLGRATPEAIAAALRPREDDFARVFIGEAAAHAQAAYAAMWAAPPAGLAQPDQTRVLAYAAPASALAVDGPERSQFPGGYRDIAGHLQPDRVWLTFVFVAPGETRGMAYDGLVWIDGRWAWFPKPWRYLRAATN